MSQECKIQNGNICAGNKTLHICNKRQHGVQSSEMAVFQTLKQPTGVIITHEMRVKPTKLRTVAHCLGTVFLQYLAWSRFMIVQYLSIGDLAGLWTDVIEAVL